MKKNIKYCIILLLILIICLILMINSDSRNIESYTNNIHFNNWWEHNDTEALHIFQTIFQDQNKNIEIYSIFGDPNFTRKDNTLYIQYSGESYYKDPNLFDINFIPNEKESENIIIFPYAAFNIIHEKLNMNYFLNKRRLDKINNQFCLFAVSNGGCSQRNEFYNELSKYKRIDSCGKYLNNMNMNCPGVHFSSEFHNFISNYKFMICFENSSKINYFTEKLINAYYNGTIPIYWGCQNIEDYVNMDSILYLKPIFTQSDVDTLTNTIKDLDNDPQKYKEKYESVFFKNGIIPNEFNIESIRNKVNNRLN